MYVLVYFLYFFPLRWCNKVVFRPATGIINRDQESILRAYVWSYLGKCLRKRRVEARRRKGQADSCRQRIVCPSGSYAHSSVHTRARTARTSLSVSIPCTRVTRLPAHSVSLWIRLVTFSFDTAATRSLFDSNDPSPTIPTPLLYFTAINALYGSSSFDIGVYPLLGEWLVSVNSNSRS